MVWSRAGLVDVEKECARLGAELSSLEKQLQALESRLANEKFVSKAPVDVVAKEKERAAGLQEQVKKLEDKLAQLRGSA